MQGVTPPEDLASVQHIITRKMMPLVRFLLMFHPRKTIDPVAVADAPPTDTWYSKHPHRILLLDIFSPLRF